MCIDLGPSYVDSGPPFRKAPIPNGATKPNVNPNPDPNPNPNSTNPNPNLIPVIRNGGPTPFCASFYGMKVAFDMCSD